MKLKSHKNGEAKFYNKFKINDNFKSDTIVKIKLKEENIKVQEEKIKIKEEKIKVEKENFKLNRKAEYI